MKAHKIAWNVGSDVSDSGLVRECLYHLGLAFDQDVPEASYAKAAIIRLMGRAYAFEGETERKEQAKQKQFAAKQAAQEKAALSEKTLKLYHGASDLHMLVEAVFRVDASLANAFAALLTVDGLHFRSGPLPSAIAKIDALTTALHSSGCYDFKKRGGDWKETEAIRGVYCKA